MSGSLEQVVRPFQNNEIFTARVVPPTQPAIGDAQDPVILTWTGQADSTYVEEPNPGSMGFSATFIEDNSKRKVDRVRITSTTDPSQFIDVNRTREATFRNSVTGEASVYKFGE